MTKQDLIDTLTAHTDELRQMGIMSLALFGSTVRNEAHARSDVDLLVEFDRPVGLFHFFTVQHRLEDLLGVSKVDLVQRGAVHPALRQRIFAEAVNVA